MLLLWKIYKYFICILLGDENDFLISSILWNVFYILLLNIICLSIKNLKVKVTFCLCCQVKQNLFTSFNDNNFINPQKVVCQRSTNLQQYDLKPYFPYTKFGRAELKTNLSSVSEREREGGGKDVLTPQPGKLIHINIRER